MIELLKSFDALVADLPLTASLISLLIKSSLILAAAGLALMLLRRSSPAVRSLVLSIVFMILLILPLLMVIVPSWHLLTIDMIPSPITAAATDMNSSGINATRSAPDVKLSVIMLTAIVLIWIAVTSLLLIRFISGWVLMNRIITRAAKAENEEIAKLFYHLKAGLGPHQSVSLIFSKEVLSPQVFGLWQHTIILPENAINWSAPELEMTLTHELAHVRRHDTFRYLLGSMAATLYWFNPLVWICRRKLINESEMACDDHVMIKGSDAYSYAAILLGIARQAGRKHFEFAVTVNMTKKSELEDRLMSIMSNHKRNVIVKSSIFVTGIVLAVAFVLPLSGLQLMAAADDNTSSPLYAQADQSSDNKQVDISTAQKRDENYPAPDEFIPVETQVEMIEEAVPVYPEEAKKQNIEGIVWVQVLVDTTGTVKDAKILKTSGNDLLDQAAFKAARECKFNPAKNDDKPVAVWISFSIEFELAEKEGN